MHAIIVDAATGKVVSVGTKQVPDKQRQKGFLFYDKVAESIKLGDTYTAT